MLTKLLLALSDVSWTKRYGTMQHVSVSGFQDFQTTSVITISIRNCQSLTHHRWTRFLKQVLVPEEMGLELEPIRFTCYPASSPSVLTTVTNVPIKPVCFPAMERTWILDLTQSTGYTAIHRQLPPKPPLSSKGMGPRVKKQDFRHTTNHSPT